MARQGETMDSTEPPLSWYEDQIRDTCRRTGIAQPDCARWLAPIVREGMVKGEGSGTIGRRARMQGKAMTSAEKKTVGILSRIKISREAFAALTAAGRADPVRAYQALVHGPMKRQLQARRVESLVRLAGMGAVRNVRAVVDEGGCCRAARPLIGKSFPVGQQPTFPLPGCDQWICRCRHDDEWARPRKRQMRRLTFLIVGLVVITLLALASR